MKGNLHLWQIAAWDTLQICSDLLKVHGVYPVQALPGSFLNLLHKNSINEPSA